MPAGSIAALIAAGMAGVLTALTPGLYPLIPLTLLTFGQGALRRLVGALTFALSVGAALALACGVVGGFGRLAAEPVHSVPGFGFLTLVCVAMGAAVLGLFPVQLPPSLAARLARVGGGGAFAVGMVSLPVATPWLAPQVAVLSILALHGGHPLQGASLAAAFAVGLGLPWLGIGLFGGRAPSGGVWMEIVRLVLAAAMWTVALYFVAQAWPAGTPLLLQHVTYPAAWGMALLFAGCSSGALMLTSRRLARASWLRTAGAALMCLGLGLVLLEVNREATLGEVPPIAWETQHDAALTQARVEHRPLVLDFTAEWCQPCKQLERETYVDPGVRRAALRFVMAKIDCTSMDGATQALFERYKIAGLPTVLFFDSQGQLLQQPRLTGYVGPDRFMEVMRSVR